MEYFLSLDCGGTKTEAVLFDESLKIHGHGISGSANRNFISEEHVRRNVEECLTRAAGDKSVKRVYVSFFINAPEDLDFILHLYPSSEIIPIDEGGMHFLAGKAEKDGFAALSGTGSGVIFVKGGKSVIHLGGYGADIGDEGSGYDMGRQAICAAIHSINCWGPDTVLTSMFAEEYGVGKDSESIIQFVTRLYSQPSTRFFIASFCRILKKAAEMQDIVAENIIRKAGVDMADQMTGLIKKHGLDPALPIVATGGAWQVSELMLEAFRCRLLESFPDAGITRALYKTVAGGAVQFGFEAGLTGPQLLRALEAGFTEYKYPA